MGRSALECDARFKKYGQWAEVPHLFSYVLKVPIKSFTFGQQVWKYLVTKCLALRTVYGCVARLEPC